MRLGLAGRGGRETEMGRGTKAGEGRGRMDFLGVVVVSERLGDGGGGPGV